MVKAMAEVARAQESLQAALAQAQAKAAGDSAQQTLQAAVTETGAEASLVAQGEHLPAVRYNDACI